MGDRSSGEELNDEQSRIVLLEKKLELMAKQFEEKLNQIRILEKELADDQTTIEQLSPGNKKAKGQKNNNKSEYIEVKDENCSDSEVQIQIEDSKQNNVGRRTRANLLLESTTTMETTIPKTDDIPTEPQQQQTVSQTPRRSGRKAKLVNYNPVNTTTSSSDNSSNSDQPKMKRGRKFNPKSELQQKPNIKRKRCRKINEHLTMETPAQRKRHMKKIGKRLANETPEEQREHPGPRVVIHRRRSDEISARWNKRFENETPEHREHRLRYLSERRKRIIASETAEEKELRLAQKRKSKKKCRANESPEERERRLASIREWHKRSAANETQEERKLRLALKRERRVNETPEQREHRLAQLREWRKQRSANETPEEKEHRFAKSRHYKRFWRYGTGSSSGGQSISTNSLDGSVQL